MTGSLINSFSLELQDELFQQQPLSHPHGGFHALKGCQLISLEQLHPLLTASLLGNKPLRDTPEEGYLHGLNHVLKESRSQGYLLPIQSSGPW